MKQSEIIRMIKESPNNALAMGRTGMANDRTFLSFLRTAVGFFAGGVALIGFTEKPFVFTSGCIALSGAVLFSIWGIVVYRKNNTILYEVLHSLESNTSGAADNGFIEETEGKGTSS